MDLRNIPDWDTYCMSLLGPLSTRSRDPNTQVGAVIVGADHNIRATGFNSLPAGVRDDVSERYERPEKYMWIEHAERNAIYAAAKIGTPLSGCSMYLIGLPCMDCGRAIIQVGIVRVIIDTMRQLQWENTTPRYVPDFLRVRTLLAEANVSIGEWVYPSG